MTNPYRESSDPSPLHKWEYCVLIVCINDMERVLNLYGSKGWEMISQRYREAHEDYRLWMKREY
jgi:hypothetical protein